METGTRSDSSPQPHTLDISANIDRENGVIRNVVICQAGELNGWHGYSLDQEFIDDLVNFARSQPDQKFRSNFNHVWGLGNQAGHIENIRLSGDKAIGDFYISPTANLSPKLPGMGDYIMEKAIQEPEWIMFSIHGDLEYYYQKLSDGSHFKVWYFDDHGYWVGSNKDLGAVYGKFKSLKRVDLTDEGAATNSLFTSNSSSMSQTIDQLRSLMATPDFYATLDAHSDKLGPLVDYFQNKDVENHKSWFKNFFSSDGNHQQMSALRADLTAAQADLSKAQEDLAAATTKITDLSANINTLTTEKSDLQTKLSAAQADLSKAQADLTAANARIVELSGQPGTQGTDPGDGGRQNPGGDGGDDLDSKIQSLSINQTALSKFRTRK